MPITAKLVANLIATAGADRVRSMDLPAPEIQGFFDIMLDHLFASPVLVKYLKERLDGDTSVLATDAGGMKIASAYAKYLDAELAFVEKIRLSDTEGSGGKVVGEIKDRNVVIVDDMITSGGTMAQAIKSARAGGAKTVIAAATHGVLLEGALERLGRAGPDEILLTDTVPVGHGSKDAPVKLTVLSVAPLLGEAIRRIHSDQSVSSLFV